MSRNPTIKAHSSRGPWGRAAAFLLPIILAWLPVAVLVLIAALSRPDPELAAGYVLAHSQHIILFGALSWLLGLLLAALRSVGPSGLRGKWIVLVVCVLPLPVVYFDVHLMIAQLV